MIAVTVLSCVAIWLFGIVLGWNLRMISDLRALYRKRDALLRMKEEDDITLADLNEARRKWLEAVAHEKALYRQWNDERKVH